MPAMNFDLRFTGVVAPSLIHSVGNVGRHLQGLKRQADRTTASLRSIGRGIRSFIGLSVGVAGLVGITRGLSEMLKLSNEYEQSLASISNSLKNNTLMQKQGADAAEKGATAVEKQADAFSRLYGIETQVLLKGSAILGQQGFTADAIQEMNRGLVNVIAKQSLLGVKGEGLVDIYEKVGKAITEGQARPLTSIGIILTAQEKALLKANAENGKFTANIALILKKINEQSKGAAEGWAKTLDGRAAKAVVRMTALSRKMGDAIDTALNRLTIWAGEFASWITPEFERFVGWLTRSFEEIEQWSDVGKIFTDIGEEFRKWVLEFRKWAPSIGHEIGVMIKGLFDPRTWQMEVIDTKWWEGLFGNLGVAFKAVWSNIWIVLEKDVAWFWNSIWAKFTVGLDEFKQSIVNWGENLKYSVVDWWKGLDWTAVERSLEGLKQVVADILVEAFQMALAQFAAGKPTGADVGKVVGPSASVFGGQVSVDAARKRIAVLGGLVAPGFVGGVTEMAKRIEQQAKLAEEQEKQGKVMPELNRGLLQLEQHINGRFALAVQSLQEGLERVADGIRITFGWLFRPAYAEEPTDGGGGGGGRWRPPMKGPPPGSPGAAPGRPWIPPSLQGVKFTEYGYKGDPWLDTESAQGIGAFAHTTRPGSLIPNYSVALNRAAARRLGVRPGQEFVVGGRRFRYDDKVPEKYREARIDVYRGYHGTGSDVGQGRGGGRGRGASTRQVNPTTMIGDGGGQPRRARSFAGPDAERPAGGPGEINVSYNPTITINGNADQGVLANANRQQLDQLRKMMTEVMWEEKRRSFGTV